MTDETRFKLAPDSFDAFVKVLDNPPPPDDRLIALMKRKPLWGRRPPDGESTGIPEVSRASHMSS